jgi:Fic family protein
MDWDQQAAGSFAMAAAVESQIHISRFAELDGNAPERLVRVQGRHLAGTEMVLRFRRNSIDYEHVLEGAAATVYPLIQQLRNAFGTQSFSPKDISEHTGASRATAHRQIARLYSAGVLSKKGYGDYVLA